MDGGTSIFNSTCDFSSIGLTGGLFVQLINTLMAAQCNLGKPDDYPLDYGDKLVDKETFDFIVVGAGSAGSVVASRLSENPKWRVLLLEAGGDPNKLSDVPMVMFENHWSEVDWGFVAEKNDYSCLGMKDEKCGFPRGKALGGSSVLNAMMYVRGNKDDYDEWERLKNKGWGYENVLKYFKKSQKISGLNLIDDKEYEKWIEDWEKIKGDKEKMWEYTQIVSKKYHSGKGLLSVGHFGYDPSLNELKTAIFEGLEELGYPHLPDINGKTQIGFTEIKATINKGSRASTSKMFLNPFKNRPNLFVVKNATVRKLLLEGKRVTSVEFVRNNQKGVVTVGKEVILSAGAISTPQILLLSGIGPKKHLESLNIPVVHHLEGVGANFQDHLASYVVPISLKKSNPKEITESAKRDALYEFLTQGSGPFASIGITSVTGFIDTVGNSSIPDIQFHHLYFAHKEHDALQSVMNAVRYKPELAQQFHDIIKNSDLLLMLPTLLRPKSVGKLELRSSNADDHPKITTNFFKEQEDIDTMIRGIQFALKLVETPPMKKLEAEVIPLKFEKCAGFAFKTVKYWECVLRHATKSLYHPVGTCKMGPKEDKMAVVDSKLKVSGLKNVRVADGSIMPVIVRGNTNAPIIMIGERGASFVNQHWNKNKNKNREEL